MCTLSLVGFSPGLACRVHRFWRCDFGAVAIDWVGLTAGILLLGVTLVYALFNGGVASTARSINETLDAAGKVIDTHPVPDQDTFK